MVSYRLHQLFELFTTCPLWSRDDQEVEKQKHLEQLGVEIIEHGKLMRQYYSRPVVVLENNLVNSFRETPYSVISALRLLERRGLAERAYVPGYWILRLPPSTNDCEVNNAYGAEQAKAPQGTIRSA